MIDWILANYWPISIIAAAVFLFIGFVVLTLENLYDEDMDTIVGTSIIAALICIAAGALWPAGIPIMGGTGLGHVVKWVCERREKERVELEARQKKADEVLRAEGIPA